VGVRVGVALCKTNLRCVKSSGICTPNLYSSLISYSFRDLSVHPDRRTWLHGYIDSASKTLPSACYILSDESSIPFTLRVPGTKSVLDSKEGLFTTSMYKNRQYFFKIQFGFLKKKTRKNAIVEYLDYQIPRPFRT